MLLALWLARRGIVVRIVDRALAPGTTSRALVVQARTLEWYRQLGIADEVATSGRRAIAVNLWASARKVARAVLGDMGAGLGPYPYALVYPQDEHEAMLVRRLAEAGVAVERGTELLDFHEEADRVIAQVKRPDGTIERCVAEYLAGCDGAHSTVRERLAVGFPGGTYERIFWASGRMRSITLPWSSV